MNAIRSVVISRATSLLVKLKESESIKHPATKGALREIYLRNFLRDVLPDKVKLYSGFITDAVGTDLSPQIDIIAVNTESLPTIELEPNTRIVPVESALLIFEVKSVLQSDVISQLTTQWECISNLKIHNVTPGKILVQVGYKIPTIICAYQNKVSESTIEQWFSLYPNLICVCIIGGITWMRTETAGAREIKRIEGDDEIQSIVVLSGKLYEVCNAMSNVCLNPNWNIYLNPDELNT